MHHFFKKIKKRYGNRKSAKRTFVPPEPCVPIGTGYNPSPKTDPPPPPPQRPRPPGGNWFGSPSSPPPPPPKLKIYVEEAEVKKEVKSENAFLLGLLLGHCVSIDILPMDEDKK